jgi:TolB-like protein/Tfp pilus assembly protein PilF
LVVVILLAGTVLTVQYLSTLTLSTQHSELGTEQAPQALALPDKPSIVVLPFQNLSGDPTQDYFSDGLTDVLTGHLSRISSLFVISRNSAFTYKGKAVKVQEVSKELGVRYVLEGSVQKADQRMRITAQLIDATTGYHLWSEQYDRPLQDLFALQDEIVQRIVTTLRLQLTLQERGFQVPKLTNNLEAYDAFLRGAEYFSRSTKEANTQARQLYEQAIALDPQYADAYVALGHTYLAEWGYRWSVDPQTLEQALALAHQALALDDSLPKAHSLLSRLYALQQQYEQALAEVERSVVLDPNNAESYAHQADVLNVAGRPEEALQAVKLAMRLDPHYPPWYLVELGFNYLMTGRYAEAIAALKEAGSRSPNLLPAHLNLAGSYLMQWGAQQNPTEQTLELAMEAAQRGLALSDSLDWSHVQLGFIYLNRQRYEQALAEMERAVTLVPTDAGSYPALAVVLSCMGRTEDALEAAAQALRLKPIIADGHLGNVGTAYALAGRYEEARAPLQRYLSYYPNLLPFHLVLAGVYSELGQTAEAQAEAAEVLRLNPKFSLAVHKQRTPIKDPAVLERHIAALRRAGLK